MESKSVRRHFAPGRYAVNKILSECLYYAHEAVGFQRSASDQTAVHVGFSEESLSVGGFAGTAIKNRGVLSNLFSIFSFDYAADVGMYFLCLVISSSLAGTDGPNGLVSKDKLGKVLCRKIEESFLNLSLDNIEMLAGLALFEHPSMV